MNYPTFELERRSVPKVEETAALLTNLLKLQHFTAGEALLALKRAGDKIAVEGDDIEALQSKAELRGLGVSAVLLREEGGLLAADAFAEKLHVVRETISQWRRQKKIISLRKGTRNFRYPSWQVHEGALLAGLPFVLAALARNKMSSLATVDYFLSESDELGGRPLDLLRAGKLKKVEEHARRYGEIGS